MIRRLLLLLAALLLTPVFAHAEPSGDGLESVPMPRLREAMRSWDALAQGWFRLKAGDPQGARDDLAGLVRQRPQDPNARHLYGIALAAVDKPRPAEIQLRRSLKLRPDGWVGLHLVSLLLEQDREAPAQKVVSQLARRLSTDPQVKRAQAYLLVHRGDLEGARQVLEAIEEGEGDAGSAAELAEMLAVMSLPEEALEATRRAVAREPQHGGYRRALFRRLSEAGHWQELVAASSTPEASQVGGGLDDYYRGVALVRLGRDQEAAEALSRVVEAPRPDALALAGAAGHLLQLGSYDLAERAARVALGDRPDDGRLHHALAMALTRMDRESEALAHYRRAADLDDTAAYRFDLLMSLCALQLQEEFDQALADATRRFGDDERFARLAQEGCGAN